MEQTQYSLLFRWFIGLSMDNSVWVPTVFTKNRERLIEHDAVVTFFSEVLKQADKKRWLPKEHFSVYGTLIQAWAGHKSFVRKRARMTTRGRLPYARGKPILTRDYGASPAAASDAATAHVPSWPVGLEGASAHL